MTEKKLKPSSVFQSEPMETQEQDNASQFHGQVSTPTSLSEDILEDVNVSTQVTSSDGVSDFFVQKSIKIARFMLA